MGFSTASLANHGDIAINMNLFKIVFSVLVVITYIVGFIYDAVFLEEFGLSYYEMVGSPIEYLSIGGIYLFSSFSSHLTIIIVISLIFGVLYMPARKLFITHKAFIEKLIHIESVPYVLVSLIPIAAVLIIVVIPDAQDAAKESLKETNDVICIENIEECVNGKVLKYRDSKVLFYNVETKKLDVYPERKIQKIEQS